MHLFVKAHIERAFYLLHPRPHVTASAIVAPPRKSVASLAGINCKSTFVFQVENPDNLCAFRSTETASSVCELFSIDELLHDNTQWLW